MVGAFPMASTIYDRQENEILISSERGPNLVEGMKTIRGSKRHALTHKRSGHRRLYVRAIISAPRRRTNQAAAMRAATDRNLTFGGSHAFKIDADTNDKDRSVTDGWNLSFSTIQPGPKVIAASFIKRSMAEQCNQMRTKHD
ncbi:hypothetical protein [Sulfitobacter sp. UBA1132]|nr:hypothetical protein [Sulfitobacter sp. UBA1132]|tara:strand:- start:195 stop:620 length:426 start_codon:yes stop_codon:yes gene_type:complete